MNMKRHSPDKNAPLWSNISIGEQHDCWLWKGAILKSGYGRVWLNGKDLRAHRAVWEAVNGPIPKTMSVCHACDVPLCCNPSHLFLGTHADNMEDMLQKGRKCVLRGSELKCAHITELQAMGIMARMLTGRETQQAIADNMNKKVSVIKDVWNGRAWRHLLL